MILPHIGLSKAIKRLGHTSGITRLHAHLFRHTFAVNYLMNGGDVMTLKLILGHTTLDVTQIYMHLAEAHVKVKHERFSPVDRLGIGFNTLSLLVFRYFVPYPPPRHWR